MLTIWEAKALSSLLEKPEFLQSSRENQAQLWGALQADQPDLDNAPTARAHTLSENTGCLAGLQKDLHCKGVYRSTDTEERTPVAFSSSERLTL